MPIHTTKIEDGKITLEMLPTDERDKALGKYMDAFSRMESMINHLIQGLLGIEWQAGNALASVLYSKQRIDLLELLASIKLPKEVAERVTKACGKLGRRNMRRNHIIHGAWQQAVTVHDDRVEMEWVRKYVPTNPDLAALRDYDDPKLLGTYSFTIQEIDRATDHVEEVLGILSSLGTEIRELLPLPPAPLE